MHQDVGKEYIMTINEVVNGVKAIVGTVMDELGEDFVVDGWTSRRVNNATDLGYSVAVMITGIDLSSYVLNIWIPENNEVKGKGYRWYPKRPYGDGTVYREGFYGRHGDLKYLNSDGKWYPERIGLGTYRGISVRVENASNYEYFSQRRFEMVIMSRVWKLRKAIETMADPLIQLWG
jgi:hypothetical protein